MCLVPPNEKSLNNEKNPLPIFLLQWEVKMIMKCSSNPLTENYSTCQRTPKHSMLSGVMLPLTNCSSGPTLLYNCLPYYSPALKTIGVSPWLNATVGPSEARRAKEDTSADSIDERKDTVGLHPWRLYFLPWLLSSRGFSFSTGLWPTLAKLFTGVNKPVDKLTTFSGVKPLV